MVAKLLYSTVDALSLNFEFIFDTVLDARSGSFVLLHRGLTFLLYKASAVCLEL